MGAKPSTTSVIGFVFALLATIVLGLVGVVSWSIPIPIIAAAGSAIGIGATFLFLTAVRLDKDQRRTHQHALCGAYVLYAIALLVAFDLCYAGYVSWPKPIVAATGWAIGLGATFLVLVAVLVREDPLHPWELLLRFLRDDHGCPSLARLQLVSWTALVIFAFAWITLIRILSGVPAFSGSFPPNVLGILLISTGSTVVARQIETSTPLRKSAWKRLGDSWRGLLDEINSDKRGIHPSLARFQMLGWTVISIGIYVLIIFVEVQHAWISGSVGALTLPDLDPTLLLLMGISQSGYLGAKYVTYNAP